MGTAVGTRQGSVYGLLVSLGARAQRLERRVLAPEVARAVAAQFGAVLLTLHGVTDGWAEAVADPLGAFARLKSLDRARVETLDARLVNLAVERDARVSALDLDKDMQAEGYLTKVLGCSDAFAVPLRASGSFAGAAVIYLGQRSLPPSETDLMALGGLGDVLALASGPNGTRVPAQVNGTAPARGFLARLLGR